MSKQATLFTVKERRIFNAALNFLERTYQGQEITRQKSAIQGDIRKALILNLTKVMNDCRAILLLAQAGFYIQAGILARSTTDACNLLMHIEFSEDDAALVEPWLEGRKVTHWMLIEEINESLEQDIQLNITDYRQMRKQLDSFVHANYEALQLYPAQLSRVSPPDQITFHSLTFWKRLVHFYLISCLLAILLLAPDLEDETLDHLDRLAKLIGAEQLSADSPQRSNQHQVS
jgi:hypothetical protein